ncbi:MAG TPA: HlyD family efflux transporter periplasmic adaptor subunit [Kofleriaceae bacterium]|jgi:biotin carboxyl carrier protein/CheY-like chemotaxis protein|nr:HlyD family efflux transporter periplasmic adaptor subunit [Kofleriaceae bacterium]
MGEWDEITQIRARPMTGSDQILLADADPAMRSWLREVVAGQFGLDEVDSGALALEWIASGVPRLVVVGRRLTDMSGGELIERASQWLAGERDAPISTFLLADPSGEAAEVDESRVRVFYRLVPTMQALRVRDLLGQASAKLPPQPPIDRVPPPAIQAMAQQIGNENDLAGAAAVAQKGVAELVGADRVRCLFCDEDTGALWAEGEESHESTASVGLAGFAVRTSAGIAVPRAAEDSLFRREVDDPAGTGRERLLVQAVTGLDGHVHAVVIAIRNEQRPPFGAPDLEAIEALASAWAPYLQQLAMRIEADNILGDKLDQGPSDMFRQEAIVSLVRRGARGDVVRVHPGWVRAAYWLVLGALGGAIAFAALAHVHQYAEGGAIVQFTGHDDVVAYEGGTISSLDVAPNQAVAAGQVVARLYDVQLDAQLRTATTNFEDHLVAYLQSPNDQGVKDALAATVTARKQAEELARSRTLVASRKGVVKDVFVRSGQHVEAGKTLLTILRDGEPELGLVVAFLPGAERPRLHVHQPLTLTLPSYRGARLTSQVTAISSVMPAKDAKTQWPGSENLPMADPVVVVEAQLSTTHFDADNQRYQLHDGMSGIGEVQLASHSVLEIVIPGLK